MSIETGPFYSDMTNGEKEDVSDVMVELAPSATPFLNSIIAGQQKAKSLTHKWVDSYYKPLSTTLNGAVTSSATSIIFDDAIYKPGQYIICEGEVIKLLSTADYLTFTCSRSAGTIAAAAHVDASVCLLVSDPANEGAAASSADYTMEPTERTNYCQREERVVIVSNETQAQERYGRPGTPFDDKVQEKLRDIKLAMNWMMLGSPAATAPAPSSGTAGVCKGLVEWILAAGNSANVAGDITQAHLRTVVEAIADYYDPEVEMNAIMLHPINQAFVFEGWQQAHVVIPPGDPLVQTYGVGNVRRIKIGPMVFDCIPDARMDAFKHAVVYMPWLVKPASYLPTTFTMLGVDGGRMRGQIETNNTVEVYAPVSGYVLYGTT